MGTLKSHENLVKDCEESVSYMSDLHVYDMRPCDAMFGMMHCSDRIG